MTMQKAWMGLTAVACAGSVSVAGVDDPWADEVVSYTSGSGAGANDDPAAALGEPTRITAPDSPFGGPVTPANPAFGAGEFVTIGEGGSLTVRFDNVIRDNAGNPFGVDLLVFGNAFYDFFSTGGTAGGLFGGGGVIELSADGVTFFEVLGAQADGAFPTLGFNADGSPTDFTRPVDPSFDPAGLALEDIIAGYGGSGGGVGIDIGAVGLSGVSFVRITNPLGSGFSTQIDAFADVVPAPSSLGVAAVAGLIAARRRRA